MKNHKKISINKSFSIFLILFSVIFFCYGFISEENSAGAGGFSGDFSNSWNNLQTFLNNDLLTAINSTGDNADGQRKYISSRPPLIWILNKFLNPFTENQIDWIRSIFFFSLLVPLLFFYCLKIKFKNTDNLKLILLSSTILLSPYFRTSSYWGLEENYGIVCILISYIFLHIYYKEKKISFVKFFKLFGLALSSSLCVYFDQKLVIIPLLIFLKIFLSNEKKILKLILTLFYSILAIPFLYLIFLWKNIIPSGDSLVREIGFKLHFSHIGFSLTIIGFYLIPLFFFKNNGIKNIFFSYLNEKKYLIIITFFLIYLCLSFFFDDYQNSKYPLLGKGIIHKLSLIFFSDILIQKIFVYLNFLLFFFITVLFLNKNLLDSLIIFFFLIISIFIYPLLQEYYDPIVLIIAFTFFSTKFNINYKNIFILYFYLLFFLVSAKIYY
jgi:hypothetical protein